MAIKLDYVARETATNLFRNVTLTLAAVLTVVVSLTLSDLRCSCKGWRTPTTASGAASSSSST